MLSLNFIYNFFSIRNETFDKKLNFLASNKLNPNFQKKKIFKSDKSDTILALNSNACQDETNSYKILIESAEKIPKNIFKVSIFSVRTFFPLYFNLKRCINATDLMKVPESTEVRKTTR